ncbi:hypothetical protein [uncultured Pseudacidovorax sp.]|uniref:hypothetical protein n=1 Tax=uncultured Pseudacidovorax sp. TaxID=679313 RepID=UPI0025FDEFDB|nr:hypothetical protein [uncultured Pseudacidovorax sp.]
MARLVVQSLDTGRFLCPSMLDGSPEWVRSLREAGGGVLTDEHQARAVAIEYAEAGEQVQLVDLDRLGTANDYVGAL